MIKTGYARSYNDRPVLSELGHGLMSSGVSRIIATKDGQRPRGIFKSDKDKSCYIEKGMYIIDYNRVETTEIINVFKVEDYGYDLDYRRFGVDMKLCYTKENIPAFLDNALYAARKRAAIYGCDESMYME